MAGPEEPAGTVEAGNASPASTLTSSTGSSAPKVSESSTPPGGKENAENEAEPEAISDAAKDADDSGGAEAGTRQSSRIRDRVNGKVAAAVADGQSEAAAGKRDGTQMSGSGDGGADDDGRRSKKSKTSTSAEGHSSAEEDVDDDDDDDAASEESVECPECQKNIIDDYNELLEEAKHIGDELEQAKTALAQYERLFKRLGGIKGARKLVKNADEWEDKYLSLEKKYDEAVEDHKAELDAKSVATNPRPTSITSDTSLSVGSEPVSFRRRRMISATASFFSSGYGLPCSHLPPNRFVLSPTDAAEAMAAASAILAGPTGGGAVGGWWYRFLCERRRVVSKKFKRFRLTST